MGELALTDHIESERDRIVESLFEWLRIPSISADPTHAPNARMLIDQFWKGLLAAGELWLELGGRADAAR